MLLFSTSTPAENVSGTENGAERAENRVVWQKTMERRLPRTSALLSLRSKYGLWVTVSYQPIYIAIMKYAV